MSHLLMDEAIASTIAWMKTIPDIDPVMNECQASYGDNGVQMLAIGFILGAKLHTKFEEMLRIL